MDEAKRKILIDELNRYDELWDNAAPAPTVSLEMFFHGNTDNYSIAANLPDDEHPGLDEFYAGLKGIRSRHNVQDVLISIYAVEEGEWPHADGIYILTSASMQNVVSWMAEICPFEVWDDVENDQGDKRTDGRTWETTKSKACPDLLPGYKAYYIWLD